MLRESPVQRRIRIMFLIRQLEIGGAERQLLTLVRGLPVDQFEVTVATMYRSGGLANDFKSLEHVRTISLDKGGRYDAIPFARRLANAIRLTRPDIIHGYMYGANEIALLAARLSDAKVVWGIRVSEMDFTKYNRWTRSVFDFGIYASRWVDLVIANSSAGMKHHEHLGMRARRHLVIPNGIDTNRFERDTVAGASWRRQGGIGAKEVVVTMVGRFDPMKDHPTFFSVVRQVIDSGRVVRFVCVGEGGTEATDLVHASAERAGVRNAVTWLKPIANPIGVYSGSDVLVSTSAFGEGFPNVLGEAMACELPCITTTTGDAAEVVGDAKWYTTPRDVVGLTQRLTTLLDIDEAARRELGLQGRSRIRSEFSVEMLVERSATAFRQLAATPRGG